MEKIDKEEIRKMAWKHAIEGYGMLTQGKFFLIFPDGSFSQPLDSSNIPNAGWDGYIGRAYFENPYDCDDWWEYCEEMGIDPQTADDTDFISNIANGDVPEWFQVDFVDEEDDKNE